MSIARCLIDNIWLRAAFSLGIAISIHNGNVSVCYVSVWFIGILHHVRIAPHIGLGIPGTDEYFQLSTYMLAAK